MKHLIRAVVVGCVLIHTAVVSAQQGPSAEFTAEFQAGADAFRLGRLDEAREHLEKARALDPKLPGPWRFLAAVAETEEKWAECVTFAHEAVRLNPTSTQLPNARDSYNACRKALGKPDFEGTYDTGTGAIAVTADQPGASVEINGLQYGSTPMAPRTYPSGATPVIVTVKKAGYLDATREVYIVPELVTDVEVTLEVDPNAKVNVDVEPVGDVTTGWVTIETTAPGAVILIDGNAPPVPDAQGRLELESGPHTITVTADGYEGVRKDVRVTKGQVLAVKADLRLQADVDSMKSRGTIIFGAGLAFAAAGVVTGVMSLRAADEARDIQGIEQTRPPFSQIPEAESEAIQPIRTREDQAAANDRAKKWSLISNISYGAAVVAIGVGAYYLVKARGAREATEKHQVSFVPVPIVDDAGGLGAAAMGEVRW